MNKSWKDKGWNNMESILDEAMPVQRRPLLPPFPFPLRIASLVLLIVGSAFWGLNLIQSGSDLNSLDAFDLKSTPLISSVQSPKAILNTTIQTSSNNKAAIAAKPLVEKAGNFASTSVSSNTVDSKMKHSAATEITENLNVVAEVQGSEEPVAIQVIPVASSNEEGISNESRISQLTESASTIQAENEFQSIEVMSVHVVEEEATTELQSLEVTPIVKSTLYPSFSIGASAGNYTFSGPTLYGQLQLNLHIPLSKSINLTLLAGAGKGILYQNTEVFLAEFSNNQTDGSILSSEAPDDDLSAYLDIESVSNALIGTQIQWQFCNKWSLALGASAAYLFNIQHKALQSTSLVPEGQAPQQIFTPSEITENFAHWNQWDLRMNASLQFHMTKNWSMAMSYNRGFSNLLKHPISTEYNIQMNSLTLGLNYKF